MRCGKCGKEYQTYNGICPYCRHTRNEKNTQGQPTIRDIPTVKSQPSGANLPRNLPHSVYRQNPTNTKKTSGNSLKFVLMGGIVLLVILSVAAVAQSFIGGSPLSASTPEVVVTSEPTIPPLYTTPTIASQQPKITYAGSKAGTLSPYSSDSDYSNHDLGGPGYTASGFRSESNPQPTESKSTASHSGSSVAYVTTIPTTIVTISQPVDAKPVSSPPKAVDPPESPPTSINEIPIFVKGTVLADIIYHENIIHYFLVLDTTYRKDDQGKYTGGVDYRYQRLYEYPLKDGWYLVRTDEPEESDEYILGLGMEDPPSATGEVLNVDKVPIEPSYIQPPTPRFRDGDIVKVRENDGSWNTYLIDYYDNSNRYDVYYTAVIVPKVDGTWGYLPSYEINHPSSAPRGRIDASDNSLVLHLDSRDGIEYIEPPIPSYTIKPPSDSPPKSPVIRSVRAERSTVDFGEIVNVILIVESDNPPKHVTWSTHNPYRGWYPNNASIAETTALGNNQWKFTISEPTSECWDGGDVQVSEVIVFDWLKQPSTKWSTPTQIHVNPRDIQTVEKPVIVSIVPENAVVCFGNRVSFTVLVRSRLPPMGTLEPYFGVAHFSYSTPDGFRYGSDRGIEYASVTENTWEGKIWIVVSGKSFKLGNIVLEEVIVTDVAGQSSDAWKTPVKVNVIGCSGNN